MWNLDNITIQGLFSYTTARYQFVNNHCTLVVGNNKDNGGNNGAGKSGLFEAIAIALTGRSLRDLRKEAFINVSADSCTVELSMSNAVLNGTLVIRRYFWRGSRPMRVELIEDGRVNSTITSTAEADGRITELTGVSREDLLRYYIISQDSDYTFFTASDSDKKQILNRITAAAMINPLAERLTRQVPVLQRQVVEIERTIAVEQGKRDLLVGQLGTLQAGVAKQAEQQRIEGEMNARKVQQSNIEAGLSVLQQQLVTAVQQLEGIEHVDSSKQQEVQKSIDDLTEKIEKEQEALYQTQRILNTARIDLDNTVQCPLCNHEFILQSRLQLTVDETKSILTDAQSSIALSQESIEGYKTEQIQQRKKYKQLQQQEEREHVLRRSIDDLKYKYNQQQKRLSDIEQDIQRLRESLIAVDKNNNLLVEQVKQQIADIDKTVQQLTERRLAPLKNELDTVSFWQYYMGRSGFMTYLANRALLMVEQTVNTYLQQFRSTLSVTLNGYKILKDGTVRERIDITVDQAGVQRQPYSAMSGGERARIKLAGALALQHMINLSLAGRGLNLLVLDETLAGVDSIGTIEFVKILSNVQTTVMFVTQNVEDASIFPNRVLIEKCKGVSSIQS